MKRVFAHWAIMICCIAASGSAVAKNGDALDKGIKIGEKVPTFKVQDHTGKSLTFKDVCGTKGVLFIFHRSANW